MRLTSPGGDLVLVERDTVVPVGRDGRVVVVVDGDATVVSVLVAVQVPGALVSIPLESTEPARGTSLEGAPLGQEKNGSVLTCRIGKSHWCWWRWS